MKILIFITVLIGTLIFSPSRSYSQRRPDSLYPNTIPFVRTKLNLDTVRASKVALVRREYKASMRTLVTDTAISPSEKGRKAKLLIDAKNKKLASILTPAEQAVLIPRSELKASVKPKFTYRQQDTDAKKKEIALIIKKSAIDSIKAEKVRLIQNNYKTELKALLSVTGMSDNVKGQKIKALIDEKNSQLALVLSPEEQARFIPGKERKPLK